MPKRSSWSPKPRKGKYAYAVHNYRMRYGYTSIIAYSCVTYYSSESKRALVNSVEKYRNLERLTVEKDSEHVKLMKNKDDECTRLTEVIKSLSEKNQNYSVNAKINS
jgi:hypothetical protein